jgi:hypothetical protein
MNIALRKPWTVDEFLAWEERQEPRYEFDGVRPVAMVGGIVNHNLIVGNLENRTRNALVFLRLASIRLMLRSLCNPS